MFSDPCRDEATAAALGQRHLAPGAGAALVGKYNFIWANINPISRASTISQIKKIGEPFFFKRGFQNEVFSRNFWAL